MSDWEPKNTQTMAPTLRKLFYLNKAFFTGQAMIFKLLRNGEFLSISGNMRKGNGLVVFSCRKISENSNRHPGTLIIKKRACWQIICICLQKEVDQFKTTGKKRMQLWPSDSMDRAGRLNIEAVGLSTELKCRDEPTLVQDVFIHIWEYKGKEGVMWWVVGSGVLLISIMDKIIRSQRHLINWVHFIQWINFQWLCSHRRSEINVFAS